MKRNTQAHAGRATDRACRTSIIFFDLYSFFFFPLCPDLDPSPGLNRQFGPSSPPLWQRNGKRIFPYDGCGGARGCSCGRVALQRGLPGMSLSADPAKKGKEAGRLLKEIISAPTMQRIYSAIDTLLTTARIVAEPAKLPDIAPGLPNTAHRVVSMVELAAIAARHRDRRRQLGGQRVRRAGAVSAGAPRARRAAA